MSARTQRRSGEPERPVHILSIYDGTAYIGEIEDRGSGRVTVYAISASGRKKVGIFDTRADAMRALTGARA
jgi:hypothetical protein